MGAASAPGTVMKHFSGIFIRHPFIHGMCVCVLLVLGNESPLHIFFSLQVPLALRRKQKDEEKKYFLPIIIIIFLSQGKTKPLLNFCL